MLHNELKYTNLFYSIFCCFFFSEIIPSACRTDMKPSIETVFFPKLQFGEESPSFKKEGINKELVKIIVNLRND